MSIRAYDFDHRWGLFVRLPCAFTDYPAVHSGCRRCSARCCLVSKAAARCWLCFVCANRFVTTFLWLFVRRLFGGGVFCLVAGLFCFELLVCAAAELCSAMRGFTPHPTRGRGCFSSIRPYDPILT